MEFGASKATSKSGDDSGTAVIAHGGILMGVFFDAAAVTDTLTIYDNATTNSGTILFKCTGSSQTHMQPLEFENGLYRIQTGTGSVSVIHVVGDKGTSA